MHRGPCCSASGEPAGVVRHSRELAMRARILALVGDCYGAQGGIARYNQDLFEALAEAGAEVLILPRLGNAAGLVLPARIRQFAPVFGNVMFSFASLWTAWRHRPVDVVFCGHAFMAPLPWPHSRELAAPYLLHAHAPSTLHSRPTLQS